MITKASIFDSTTNLLNCRQQQQSMDDDNGNTQQSNSTREKGDEDGTNEQMNERTNG